MINLNQLLDQLQPTQDAPGKAPAGLEGPSKESFLFSDVLGDAQKGEAKSSVLDLEGGPHSLEDWVESSLLELSLDQQQALLAALFTLEEGLSAQIDPGAMMEKAQAKVDAFWSALEGLLEEWRNLMAQGDLLTQQLSQTLEPEVRRSVVERLDHLAKLESEGIWNQIIHWIGRFMERDQGDETPSAFALVEMPESQVSQIDAGEELNGESSVANPLQEGQESQVSPQDLAAQSIEENTVGPAALTTAENSRRPAPVVSDVQLKQIEQKGSEPLTEGTKVSEEKLSIEKGAGEKNQALQQKILKALEAVARRADPTQASLSAQRSTLEGIEVQQGDPDNMWSRIRRWLADRLVQENIAKVQSGEVAVKAPENLSKGGAVEFLKFVATLQRKGFGQAAGFEAEMASTGDGEKTISPEVRRRLPLSTPPIVRQASYGLLGQDSTPALLQYGDKAVGDVFREAMPSEGAKPAPDGVGGNRESQEPQVKSEMKGEAAPPTRDPGRWDPSILQRFVNSTRTQFQLWADRKFVAMQVQLEPEALGRMQLKTILENGRIGVLIQVEQPAARELLNSHLDHLRGILEERGLEVAAFHVEVRQQQTGGGQGFYGPKKHGPRFDLEALMQDSEGELQVESPILRGLINKVA